MTTIRHEMQKLRSDLKEREQKLMADIGDALRAFRADTGFGVVAIHLADVTALGDESPASKVVGVEIRPELSGDGEEAA